MPIPPFVSALRDLVGTHPLWLPGVSGIVLDDADRVLLVRRAEDGVWTVVSGILEPGEEPAVGLTREVLEETGVEVRVESFSALSVTDPVVYANGDQARYVDLCFVCRPADPESAERAHVADDESSAVGWFATDDLPEPMAASSRDRLAWTLTFLTDPTAGPRFAH